MKSLLLILLIGIVVLAMRLILGRCEQTEDKPKKVVVKPVQAATIQAATIQAKLLSPIKVEAATPAKELTTTEDKIRYGSEGEEISCKYMSRRFGMLFKSHRPSFLRNPKTGRNLELDCWNIDAKVAVEYNGRQHYVFTRHFFSDVSKFEDQQYRDRLKAELCEKNGIKLITVPYTILGKENIESFIESQLVVT